MSADSTGAVEALRAYVAEEELQRWRENWRQVYGAHVQEKHRGGLDDEQ